MSNKISISAPITSVYSRVVRGGKKEMGVIYVPKELKGHEVLIVDKEVKE